MKYDHQDPFHRTFLATHLREGLQTAGFTTITGRHPSEEEVWVRPVEGTKFQIKVFTSIVGNQVRMVGADAIRVVGSYENDGKTKGLVGNTSVHRRGKVEDIKERTIQRARETWLKCRTNGKCKCGAPLLVSKKGNAYCADLCWKA